jgi:hypothetical protein
MHLKALFNLLRNIPKGQALVEYMFVMLFIIGISVKLVGSFTDFFRDSMGNLGHVLTLNLMVGVCADDCFFSNYKNGYKK